MHEHVSNALTLRPHVLRSHLKAAAIAATACHVPRARSFPETNNLLVGYFLGPLRGCPENADVRYIYLALAAPPAYLSALGLTSAYLSVSVTSNKT